MKPPFIPGMMQTSKYLFAAREELGTTDAALKKLNHEYGIEIKRYKNSVVLNYLDYALLDPTMRHTSEIIAECRGLHLSLDDFSVISRAFPRFFNYGEPGTENFDFNGARVYDKIDGSLIILYFSPETEKWEFRTRGTAFAETMAGGGKHTFRDLILKTIGFSDTDEFEKFEGNHTSDTEKFGLYKSLCYVFEFVSPETRVIVPYKERALYYITAFNRKTGSELRYDNPFGFESLIRHIPCKKIQSFSLTDIDDVLHKVANMPELAEGYIVRNANNKRIKVKNPLYVSIHHLHNNGLLSTKRILELIETGEDTEYLAYFPETANEFNAIHEKREAIFASCQKTFDAIKDIESQKDFALEAMKYPYNALLFRMRQGASLEEIWTTSKMSFKEKLLGISDTDVLEEGPKPTL